MTMLRRALNRGRVRARLSSQRWFSIRRAKTRLVIIVILRNMILTMMIMMMILMMMMTIVMIIMIMIMMITMIKRPDAGANGQSAGHRSRDCSRPLEVTTVNVDEGDEGDDGDEGEGDGGDL